MVLFRKAEMLSAHLAKLRSQGLKTGFVPTMGALHPGHISLIRQARESSDVVVCSIFINPTQFNDPADFEKYPVTTENDLSLLTQAGCDIVFFPSVAEMYPAGAVEKRYDLGYLETILEGRYRPGHFQGVCRVIDRFLQVVRPQLFFLGQKDYQQCMVVARLITILGMEQDVELVISPTMREKDGLAMSSRNTRLDANQRETAVTIYRALRVVRDGLNHQPAQLLISRAVLLLQQNGFRVDYVEIASATDLRAPDEHHATGRLVVLAAAFLGEVRLIDNLLTGNDA